MHAKTKPIRILHLEDNLRDSEFVRDMLMSDDLDCEIRRAGGRAEFETALLEHSCDIVLTDFNVPDYDGISALQFVRSRTSTLPVIVISGSIGEDAAVKCLRAGATDYLLKDRLDRLPSAVRRALQEAEEEKARRRVENALRQSEERFSLVAKATSDAIWDWDLGTKQLWWGGHHDDFAGTDTEHMANEVPPWASSVHPEDLPRVRQKISACLSGNDSFWSDEYRFRRRDGAYATVTNRASIVRDTMGQPVRLVGGMTDITDRKSLLTQLHRMQRVESVSRLASGIAHDMNNILAPIMMSAALLRSGVSPLEAEKILSTVETSAQRGAALVRQLLLFGRGVEGERRPVDLAGTVTDLARISQQTFPRNITITTQLASNLARVHGDATQLHQVLLNLCVNARDAMPDGGALTIAAENIEIDEVQAAADRDGAAGKYVLVSVTDTGTGIPPEVAERIFDPFYTTKDPNKGTGLGLSTVLGIVKGHQGFIRMQSVVGQGTTFSVYLPASVAATAAGPTTPSSPMPRGHGELILVVDDEDAIRAVLRDTLVRFGYKVATAPNGIEAVAVFGATPDVRLVLTDLDMPLMDGVALARVLRQLKPATKFLISTGIGERTGTGKRQQDLEDLGIHHILTKPYSVEKLLTAVREALGEPLPRQGGGGLPGTMSEMRGFGRS